MTTPDPARILAFPDADAWYAWLADHHGTWRELWLRIYKKGSGAPTVTYAEAVDAALCWGWIDGQKLSYDEASFLQRFTPRRPASPWSQVNRGHVARLTAAGRMAAPGLREVERAKADGRWDAAYAPSSTMAPDEGLLAALAATPGAKAAFEALDKTNRFAICYRAARPKTPAGRAKAAAELAARLASGWVPHPKG